MYYKYNRVYYTLTVKASYTNLQFHNVKEDKRGFATKCYNNKSINYRAKTKSNDTPYKGKEIVGKKQERQAGKYI